MQNDEEIAKRTVVVDAGAVIRGVRLERVGGKLVTTPGVLAEIRDRQARANLITLPVDIETRAPMPEALNFIKRFAKETGDLGFLSQNDMELMALAYQLQRETGEHEHLRFHPAEMKKDDNALPFSWGPEEQKTGSKVEGDGESAKPAGSPASKPELPAFPESDDESGSDSESDSESDGEWITPQNISRMSAPVTSKASANIKVACITGDYSCQNVLLQIGLHLLTFDGFAIRSVKLWGLICRACHAFTRESTRMFCPKCGNATVDRVPITVEDGEVKVHDHRRRRNLKGTIYSIPKPKGGRHGNQGLIFAEDQMMMGGRDREFRHQQNVYEKERQMRDPFATDTNLNWYARQKTAAGNQAVTGSAPRVTVGFGRKNPNANNFKRKKK